MIPKECKRLAEVDFPIAEVSRHAAREKSIRHGHPSTLHLWWARRPLASSRAVLMALLLPDPCDPHCPDEFKTEARALLLTMRGRPTRWNSTIRTDEGLRKTLLQFIADFANWDNCTKTEYLETSRRLVKAAHPEETPLVVDPFAGGGSIPLEALRVGCDTFASDLNPVACLILKVMLEDIPRHGPALADELRKAGADIKATAEKELAELYPIDADGSTPLAYLWARTVRCEAPNCGSEIPIYRSPWLSKRGASKARYFRESEEGRCTVLLPEITGPGGPVQLRIAKGQGRETPAPGYIELKGTKANGSNANVICPCCNNVLPGSQRSPRVPQQLAHKRGCIDVDFDETGHRIGGARLLAVVTTKPHQQGRHYRVPTDSDYAAVLQAQKMVANIHEEWQQEEGHSLCPIPTERVNPVRPSPNARGLSAVTRYGVSSFGDLFTARQKATLVTLGRLVKQTLAGQDETVRSIAAMCIDKVAMQNSTCCRWKPSGESLIDTFGRQALPMVWDFAESTPIGGSTGDYSAQMEWMAESTQQPVNHPGLVQFADAANHPLPNQSAAIWFTDPPYYDQIPYADLSDFFLVWLKRTLQEQHLLRDPLDPSNDLSPKEQESVWNQAHSYDGLPKDAAFFESAIARAFKEGRRTLSEEGVGTVVFAHQSTEGWESFLNGLISSGWTVTASWPIATEMASRIRARDNASLATSIHMACRPRSEEAPVGEWADVLRELPTRVGDWMQRLQGEGIRGADLVFACIGPALEIYSRYTRVETAEGHQVALPDYLERVWEVVGREALQQVLGTAEAQARNGAAGALEEDARLTALFLWTMQATDEVTNNNEEQPEETNRGDEARPTRVPGFSLPFDVARRFAQPLGIHMEDWEKRIIQTEKGVVKLRPVTDRTRELFGEAGADNMADEIESAAAGPTQMSLFPEEAPTVRGRRRAASQQDQETGTRREATTLDRVHAAMLLQASGRTQALRNLLRSEQDRGPDFLRLANALSALYPKGSEEKRLLDGMLLAAPR